MKRLILFSQMDQSRVRGLLLIIFGVVLSHTPVHTQEIICPANLPVLPCNVPPTVDITGEALLVDLCPNPVVGFSDVTISGGCPNTYTIVRTFTVTDDCQNSLACTQVISVVDNVPPMITCPPPAFVPCEQPPVPPITGFPVVMDACDPLLLPVFVDTEEPGPCPYTPVIVREWQVADACGNSNICIQIITVLDVLAPIIDCPSAVTVECPQSTDPDVVGIASAVDNCSANISITHFDGLPSGTWPWLFERTWTAVDDCGNAAFCVQTITVEDTQSPEIKTAPGPLIVHCGDTPVLNYWLSQNGGAMAIDGCSAVTWSNDFSGTICGDSVVVTFVATDEAGNTSWVTAMVWEVAEVGITENDPLYFNYKKTCVVCPQSQGDVAQNESNAVAYLANMGADGYLSYDAGVFLPPVSLSGETISEEAKKPKPIYVPGTGRTTGHIVEYIAPPVKPGYQAKGTGRTTGHIAAKVTGTGRTTPHLGDLFSQIPRPIEALSEPVKMVKPNIPGPDPCACGVNSHTGNLYVQDPLLYIPTLGPALEFTLSYNSGKTGLRHGFGNGWTFNYNLLWEREGDNLIVRRGDGRQDIFTAGNGVFAAPAGVSDTLIEVAPDQFILKNKYGTTYYFDNPDHRRVTKVAGRNAGELLLTYQDSLPASISDQYGRALQLTYRDGLLRTVTDATADPVRTVLLEYDDDQNLQRVTDPLGYTRSYRYDINRNIIQTTDPNGNIAEVEYTDNNAVKVLRSAIATMTIEYDSAARETVLSQQVGDSIQVATYLFDTQDRAVAIKGNCCGFAVQYAYDDQNNITQITDANGNTYQYTYDTRGNVLSETDPLGQTQTFAYDPQFSQLMAWKDRKGNTTEMTLDSRGNAVQIKRPQGNVTALTYQSDGLLASFTDANGHTTTCTYDDFGYLSALERENVRLGYRYDPVGRLQELVTPNGDTVRIETDVLGRVVRYTDPLGHSAVYRYDGNWNLLHRVDQRGFATRYRYDVHNRLIRTEQPLDVVTEYAYDAKGNLVYQKDPNGNETRWGYNTRNQRISETDALGHTQSWQYDANGNLIRRVNKKGRTTNHLCDVLNRRTETVNALGEKTTYSYDANGNNIAITSPTNITVVFAYDSLDRLVRQELPFTTIQMHYDPVGNLIAHTDGNGNVTVYTYDALNRLQVETDALGQTTTYTYDANGNVKTVVNKRGHATHYTYDALNRPTKRTNALGDAVTTAYDANGNRTAVTDERGFVTTFHYDALSRLIRKEMPIGVETYTYDKNSNLVAQTDAGGRTTGHTYDALNREVVVTHPDNSTMQSVYDAIGNLTTLINENSEPTLFEYDALDRMISIINAEQEPTIYSYDSQGNQRAIAMPTGNTMRTVYDRQGRVIAQYDDLGMLGSRQYDAAGNVVEDRDGLGNTIYTVYDVLNRPVGMTDALGATGSVVYDALNNPVSITDRQARITGHTYDALNRRNTETDALGNTTQYFYDPAGNLIGITDAKGNVTTYQYDGNKRLTRETFADGTTKEYAYNPIGNRIARKDNKGDVTNYAYDARNRMTGRSYPDGAADAFAYDATGRLLAATNSTANLVFAYDQVGRIVSESLNGRTTQYAYDISNRQRTLTYPSGQVVLETADARGRPSKLLADNAPIAEWMYDFADRMVFRKYGNNTITTACYNANGWVTNLTHEQPTIAPNKPFGGDYQPFLDFRYTRDAEGNSLSEAKYHAPDRSEIYTYDAIYRLVGFRRGNLSTGAYSHNQTFDYDPLGNRTQLVQDGFVTTYAANAMNEYTAISGQANPVYDANGNLVGNGIHTFRYDFENRLLAVDNGATAEYRYDALGRRIQKSAFHTVRRYYFDGVRIIEERDSSDAVVATYLYGGWVDDVLYRRRAGAEYYYHHNALGSVVAITDAAGALVEQYEYDAFGKPIFRNADGSLLLYSAVENDLLFTGRQWDRETRLYYYRARYYDPEQGRFLQRDKLGHADDLNGYGYVQNNPVNYLDPYGFARIQITATLFDEDDLTKFFWAGDDPIGNFDLNFVVNNEHCKVITGDSDPAAYSHPPGLTILHIITESQGDEAACCCPEEVQSRCNRYAVNLIVIGADLKITEEDKKGIEIDRWGVKIKGGDYVKTEYNAKAGVYTRKVTFEACPALNCKDIEIKRLNKGQIGSVIDMGMGEYDYDVYINNVDVKIEGK